MEELHIFEVIIQTIKIDSSEDSEAPKARDIRKLLTVPKSNNSFFEAVELLKKYLTKNKGIVYEDKSVKYEFERIRKVSFEGTAIRDISIPEGISEEQVKSWSEND
jgi:hypothetical protein